MRWTFGLAVAAGMVTSLFAGGAYAAPTRTGTTQTVVSGTVVPGSFLGVAGNCVQAADKIFGNFAGTGDRVRLPRLSYSPTLLVMSRLA